MAVVLRLRGHRAPADHWEPCPLNNGPALAAASPPSVASIPSQERLNIRSRDAGASGHTGPGRGRTLKPLHDDQGPGGGPLSATVGHVGRIVSRPYLPSGGSECCPGLTSQVGLDGGFYLCIAGCHCTGLHALVVVN